MLSQLDARARSREDTGVHNDHAREAPRVLPAGATGVRDGFDTTVREVSSKAKQASDGMHWGGMVYRQREGGLVL